MTTYITKTNNGSESIEEMYCSAVSKENKEDPIGTAARHDRYLFIEIPLPWTSKIEGSRHFPEGLTEVLADLEEKGWPCRIQALICDDTSSPEGKMRIMYFERPERKFAQYDKWEYVIPTSSLLSFVQTIIAEKGRLDEYKQYKMESEHIRELFVCTHGSRDRCCGTFGFPIYDAIKKDHSSDTLRVWRTSHMGGHRLAPTMIDLPEGRCWAHVTPQLLQTLIHRKGAVKEVYSHYRGWSGLDAFAQPVEREALLQEGWDWLTYEKEATVEENEDGTEAVVQLMFTSADGNTSGTYEAKVSATSTVQGGGCGDGVKEVKQFEVYELVKKE